eukprot:Platyproteum_vivax@DN803_c0_g1_i1.p2
MIDRNLMEKLPFPLISQSLLTRYSKVYAWAHRSKSLFRPAAAVIFDVHFFPKIVPGARLYGTDVGEGKLHHYRWAEGITRNSLAANDIHTGYMTGTKVSDRDALKYQDDLIGNVKTTLLDVFGTSEGFKESELN